MGGLEYQLCQVYDILVFLTHIQSSVVLIFVQVEF